MISPWLNFDAVAMSISFNVINNTCISDKRQNINIKEEEDLWTGSTRHFFCHIVGCQGTCQDGEGSSR